MHKQLVLGIDVDGVLADFNRGLKQILFEITGERKIDLNEEPNCWSWPTAYGYTKANENEAWDRINKSEDFWASLRPMFGAQAFLQELAFCRGAGHEVYFMTTRTGESPHLQSAFWIQQHGFSQPTVAICRNNKGGMAQTVGLTHFIDDKPDNCLSVRGACPDARIFLLRREWNTWFHDKAAADRIEVIPTTLHFMEEVSTDAKSR